MDDVSEEFGDRVGGNLKTEFDIKHNGIGVSGINTSFGAVLVDNVFQKPFYGDVGSILESDYRIIGTGETISFTGTRREDLPKGGIINEFSVGVGSNYQVPRRAIGVAIVNGSGNITNVNIGGTGGEGAGYRSHQMCQLQTLWVMDLVVLLLPLLDLLEQLLPLMLSLEEQIILKQVHL